VDDFLQDPAMIQEFLVESEELLQRMDQDMVALETCPKDSDLLNRIFRALHTIKGTSGFLNFAPIVRLSHSAEDVLNTLRKGETQLTKKTMDALLSARDQLGRMLTDIREGGLKEYSIDGLLADLKAVQQSAPAADLRLGEILVADGTLHPAQLQTILQNQATSPESPKLGELLVREGLASAVEVGSALAAQQHQKAKSESVDQSMRVNVRKLDELIDLIGELVLERNRLVQLSRDFTSGHIAGDSLEGAFSQSTARLSFITEELQSAGLKTRMVPIDTVFRKFPRLVRDVAQSVQKEVELQIQGQDTELDKTMVELIGDPLVHLVRNSLDHGIELPEVRGRAGKSRHGTIRLEARQEGDHILIAVVDDGQGIDPQRVLGKAIEKGLVDPERAKELSEREILEFVFLPGFSTAEKVNNLSGRGVGMDVVRTNLKRMNGTVQVESVFGKGTTVLLQLPLTLAILPVLLVEVCREVYALPLRSVLETARTQAHEIHCVEGSEVLQLRGETLPLLRLKNLFASTADKEARAADKAVILAVGEKRVAILVDRLLGQESTVIKPLGSCLRDCASIAGATIGGDGRVRLVLDPAGLLGTVEQQNRQELVTP